MAIAFFIVGIALIVSAFRNTQGQLGTLVAGDFSGSNSFLYWLAVAGILGAAGYVPTLRSPSRWFMGLLVIVLMLTQGKGFFSQLSSALSQSQSQAATPVQNPATPTTGIPINLLGSSSSGGGLLSGLIPGASTTSSVSPATLIET